MWTVANIKVPFYTTDIDILRVASMHRIDIWTNRYTSTRGGVLKRWRHPVVCRGSVPAAGGWSSPRLCRAGTGSDALISCRSRWTWSPGSRQGVSGSAEGLSLRSEMDWTDSPLRRAKQRETLKPKPSKLTLSLSSANLYSHMKYVCYTSQW